MNTLLISIMAFLSIINGIWWLTAKMSGSQGLIILAKAVGFSSVLLGTLYFLHKFGLL